MSELKVLVKLPPVLQPLIKGSRDVEASGENVGQVLEDLVSRHPDLRWQIFSGENGFDSEHPVLNRYVNVYRNDEEIRVLQGLATPVQAGDIITLLPAMAGGGIFTRE
jgi:molybdopterin synthase sulfur carrier subunit